MNLPKCDNIFKTDLNSLLCLLKIGQSTFPNFTSVWLPIKHEYRLRKKIVIFYWHFPDDYNVMSFLRTLAAARYQSSYNIISRVDNNYI